MITRDRIETLFQDYRRLAGKSGGDVKDTEICQWRDLALRGLKAQWVSVKERIPRTERIVVDGVEEECDFVPVLFYAPNHGGVCAGRFHPAWRKVKAQFASLQGGRFPKSHVTHWMPLPPAPEEKP